LLTVVKGDFNPTFCGAKRSKVKIKEIVQFTLDQRERIAVTFTDVPRGTRPGE
jgi:hypothetical protein